MLYTDLSKPGHIFLFDVVKLSAKLFLVKHEIFVK